MINVKDVNSWIIRVMVLVSAIYLCNTRLVHEGRYIPMQECICEGFQTDRFGNFRTVVGDERSKWVSYQQVATLNIEDDIYIGVSKFFEGSIPTEYVLKVKKVDIDGDTDFHMFKVADLDQDLVLDSGQIEDLLRENETYSEDYIFYVGPTTEMGFLKIKITEIDPAGSFKPDKLLNVSEVTDFVIDAFSSSEYDIFDTKKE